MDQPAEKKAVDNCNNYCNSLVAVSGYNNSENLVLQLDRDLSEPRDQSHLEGKEKWQNSRYSCFHSPYIGFG